MLELDGVNTFRGPAQILRGVSLRVGAGEAVCLVGRNGAGKTTTIDSIMGLLPVRSGRVVFRGHDITRLPPHRRARHGIGYAPEDAGIFPDLTVAENFEITRWLAGGERAGTAATGIDERIAAVFPEVSSFLTRRGLHLSGGQKKMVAIARAMALSPAILLLDEPTSGVSTREKAPIMDIITAIVRSRGITAVIIEHDMDIVFKYSDRIVVMHQGTILADGTPDEIRANATVTTTLIGTTTP